MNIPNKERYDVFKWIDEHDEICPFVYLGINRFSYSQGSSDSCEYILEITCLCGATKEVSICNKEIDV